MLAMEQSLPVPVEITQPLMTCTIVIAEPELSHSSSSSRTSFDEHLACQVHEDEVQALCAQQRGEAKAHIPVASASQTKLNSLSSASFVQHIPRVNSSIRSSPAQAYKSRSRLLTRLEMYGLCEREVSGDGNCQFRAISDQLYRSPHNYRAVRSAVTHQLRKHPELYGAYVPDMFEEYCYQMDSDGTWGDHVTLQAAADAFGVQINVLTSFKDSCFIEIQPTQVSSSMDRVLYLSFWAEVHYNSVYPADDPPRTPEQHRNHPQQSLQVLKQKLFGSRKLHRLVRLGLPDN